jgi:hypothetical protein
MYGLSNNFPFDEIAQEQISQICFGHNHIIFQFGDSVSISSMCSMVIDQDVIEEQADVCLNAGRLLALLHQEIELVTTENGKDLKITFANGTIFILRDDSENYESYIVDIGSKRYVI